jgi:hypothetical protein
MYTCICIYIHIQNIYIYVYMYMYIHSYTKYTYIYIYKYMYIRLYTHLGNWGDAGQLTKWGIFAGGAGYILGKYIRILKHMYVNTSIYARECITCICVYVNLRNGGYSQEELDIY